MIKLDRSNIDHRFYTDQMVWLLMTLEAISVESYYTIFDSYYLID